MSKPSKLMLAALTNAAYVEGPMPHDREGMGFNVIIGARGGFGVGYSLGGHISCYKQTFKSLCNRGLISLAHTTDTGREWYVLTEQGRAYTGDVTPYLARAPRHG